MYNETKAIENPLTALLAYTFKMEKRKIYAESQKIANDIPEDSVTQMKNNFTRG